MILLGELMKKHEQFVYSKEEDDETPKQSPQSSQTWPMDNIHKSRRFQLSSPVTPKRNYSISHSKSLLLQCLRDSKTDPLPLSRRFLASSCSGEGILMDGVLVTSATTTTAKKKVLSDSLYSSLGKGSSARSSIINTLHKNAEFCSPRTKSGCNQETTNRSQKSSAGQGKVLANNPLTKLETPTKATTNPSKLKATAEPFTFTPRRPVSTLPRSNLRPTSYGYPRPLHGPPRLYFPPQASPYMPHLYETHYLVDLPIPSGNQMHHDFNQSSIRNNLRISLLPTTPPSSQKLDLPSPSDGLDPMTQTQDLSSLSDELDTMMQAQDLSSSPSSAGLESMKTKKEDWSPSDDGLETFTQAQTDFTNSHDRILPDDAFEGYTYRKRLPIFTQLCLE